MEKIGKKIKIRIFWIFVVFGIIHGTLDCNYWKPTNGSQYIEWAYYKTNSCIEQHFTVNETDQYSEYSQCINDNELELINYTQNDECNGNNKTYNVYNHTSNDYQYICNNTGTCDYVKVKFEGPHPIKCDEYWHEWEIYYYITGCYGNKMLYCNETNIFISYYLDNNCQTLHETIMYPVCKCDVDLQCMHSTVLECSNPINQEV